VRADTLDYLRTLAGRNLDPALEVTGSAELARAARAARVVF
jgi:hypothetical protein